MNLAALLLAAGAHAQPLPAFMAGCWELADGHAWTQECWMKPKAGMMLGASSEGIGTKLSSWEQMRVEQTRDGGIVLFASPEGRPAVAFVGRPAGPFAVEFTNAAHDYPQRIRYELKRGRLEAEISLINGSRPIHWTYRRETP